MTDKSSVDLVDMENLTKILDSYKNIIRTMATKDSASSSHCLPDSSAPVSTPTPKSVPRNVSFSENPQIILPENTFVGQDTVKNINLAGLAVNSATLYYALYMLVAGAVLFYMTSRR